MKNYIKILSLSIFAVFLLTTTGCNDDDEFANVSINSLSETSAYALDPVTITGTNLNTVQFVYVGKAEADFTSDGSSIVFTVPEDAPIGKTYITLVIASNYRVVTEFEVTVDLTPLIYSISSTAVAEGGTLRIKGLSYNTEYGPVVKIGGKAATITGNTGTELSVTVPTGFTAYQQASIEVTTNNGTVTYPLKFFVGANKVLNGDLENGSGEDFTNWGKWNGGSGMTAVAGDESYYGRSMKVVGYGGGNGSAWRTQFVSDAVDMVVNQQYKVIVTVKSDAAEAAMRVSTNPSALYTGDQNIPNTWTQLEFNFTANVASARVVLDMGHSTNPFVIDNVTLIPVQ